jgi:hypothetical protein
MKLARKLKGPIGGYQARSAELRCSLHQWFDEAPGTVHRYVARSGGRSAHLGDSGAEIVR